MHFFDNKKQLINSFLKIVTLLLFFTLITINSFSYATEDLLYIWNNQVNTLNAINTSNKIISNYIKPITNNPLNLNCGSACLMDENTGTILYDYKMHEKLRPASVTKIMSLLLIMEALDSGKIKLEDQVPCTEDAAKMGGSQIWLDVRETLSVNDMLKAICVVSANDCVVAMANYLEGSQQAFVNKMNEKAKQLNMNDTSFKNCHGIDEDGHLTSAYDIAIMSRELLLKHPKIKKYTTIWMDTLRNGKSSLINTNKLIKNYKGCTGLKTGSTSLALYNLSASATRNNLSLISVILKSPESKLRFELSKQLLDYGFNNYSIKSFGKKNEIIKDIKVLNGLKDTVTGVLETDANILISTNTKDKISTEIILSDSIKAPILKNQKLGELIIKSDNKKITSINIISNESINKLSFKNSITIVFKKYFKILE